MQLAISTLCVYRQREASIPRLIGETPSIRNWEIMDDGYHRLDKKLGKELRAMTAAGYRFSVHAPFSSINLAEHEPSLRNHFVEAIEKSIYRAAEAGATIEVVHAGVPTIFGYFYPEDARTISAASLAGLVRYGRTLGVEVVAENGVGQYDLFNTLEKITRLLDGHDEIPTCLDIGHAAVTGDLTNLILNQPRVRHIHVHDNSGKHDEHLVAGKGTVNWPEVCRLLNETNYRGFLVAENHSIEDALQTVNHLQRVLEQIEI